jgi:hypothetical protein
VQTEKDEQRAAKAEPAGSSETDIVATSTADIEADKEGRTGGADIQVDDDGAVGGPDIKP